MLHYILYAPYIYVISMQVCVFVLFDINELHSAHCHDTTLICRHTYAPYICICGCVCVYVTYLVSVCVTLYAYVCVAVWP